MNIEQMTYEQRTEAARDLRRAAHIVESGGRLPYAASSKWSEDYCGACTAIESDRAARAFSDIFREGRKKPYLWPRNQLHRGVRVIALLLAAEFLERP